VPLQGESVTIITTGCGKAQEQIKESHLLKFWEGFGGAVLVCVHELDSTNIFHIESLLIVRFSYGSSKTKKRQNIVFILFLLRGNKPSCAILECTYIGHAHG
jgi:hypothetical protein